MGNKDEKQIWKKKCMKLFERKKQKCMSKIGRILDEFCREVWHCTLYQGGAASGSPDMYELYRGLKIDDDNYMKVISQEEILNDSEFQEWYHQLKEQNT